MSEQLSPGDPTFQAPTDIVHVETGAEAGDVKIRSITDVDGLVTQLRRTRYAEDLGYEPPFLMDSELPQPIIAGGTKREPLVTTDNLVSALMYNSVKNFPGVLKNPQLEILSEVELSSTAGPVDPPSVTAFAISADMVTPLGKSIGPVRRVYALYHTTSTEKPIPDHLARQSRRLYPHVDFENEKVLWLHSYTDGGQDALKKRIKEVRKQIGESKGKAIKVEGNNLRKPHLQGGLVKGK